MRRYNPTRRGDIETGGCKCGWDRRRKRYVANGCKLHPKRKKAILAAQSVIAKAETP